MGARMSEVTIFICPRCQQRCVRAMYSGDFEHACFGTEVLQNESILVIGKWQDYTGSDANVQNALRQGQENALFGTRAGIEGNKFQNRDSRGFPNDRFRSRQHIETISEDFFKNPSEHASSDPEIYDND